jgi:hypothetical protein
MRFDIHLCLRGVREILVSLIEMVVAVKEGSKEGN